MQDKSLVVGMPHPSSGNKSAVTRKHTHTHTQNCASTRFQVGLSMDPFHQRTALVVTGAISLRYTQELKCSVSRKQCCYTVGFVFGFVFSCMWLVACRPRGSVTNILNASFSRLQWSFCVVCPFSQLSLCLTSSQFVFQLSTVYQI